MVRGTDRCLLLKMLLKMLHRFFFFLSFLLSLRRPKAVKKTEEGTIRNRFTSEIRGVRSAPWLTRGRGLGRWTKEKRSGEKTKIWGVCVVKSQRKARKRETIGFSKGALGHGGLSKLCGWLLSR